MEKLKTICQETNWERIGIAAYYGYFAVNILMKAFAYDHGDDIYQCFFIFGMIFLGLKLVTTKYNLREVAWAAILGGVGLALSIITKQNTWLLLFLTIIGMKNCSFRLMIKLALYIRAFCAVVLVLGSTYGFYDMGDKTKPNVAYEEIPVYSFGLGEPNYAFLTIFILLLLLLYYNYEKLNQWWFIGTMATAWIFYDLTFCRTGIIVFCFCWALIIFEKFVKNEKWKAVLAYSVPVGAVLSFLLMVFYNGANGVMARMNHYVSGRIYIMNSYYKNQGLAFYPRNQEYFYANYFGLIDNTYMFVLLYCGWAVAIFFFILVCRTLYVLYRQKHYKELVMIATMALYAVLEQFVMNGFMNPFILLSAILLYPDILREGEVKI